MFYSTVFSFVWSYIYRTAAFVADRGQTGQIKTASNHPPSDFFIVGKGCVALILQMISGIVISVHGNIELVKYAPECCHPLQSPD